MRCFVTVIGVLVMIAIMVGVSFGDGWQYTTVDANGSVGHYTSLALDSQDYAHISYYDADNQSLKYAKWTGSGWEIQTIDSSSSSYKQIGRFTSIALDNQECPHISYVTYYNNQDPDIWVYSELKYAVWTGSEWDKQILDYVEYYYSGGSFKYTSIDLDSQDHPHISYNDWDSQSIKYKYFTGSHWETKIVDSELGSFAYNCLALDSEDRPHISYLDNENNNLKYAHWTGSVWELQVVDSDGDVGTHNSIALDSQDNPHISYCIWYSKDCGFNYTDRELKYAFWTGVEWDIQVVDPESLGLFGGYTSISMDIQDEPHISYKHYDPSYLKYAYWTGSEWEITIVDDSYGVGACTSITLDSQDIPHISYTGYSGHGTLKYAWYGDPMVGFSLDNFTAHPEGFTIFLTWHVQTTEGEQIAGFNLYRRELSSTEPNSFNNADSEEKWLKINPHLIPGENPYSYTDSDVESGVAYEYKLEVVLADDAPEILGTTQATAGQPNSFAILALYPNPVSDMLTCLLALPEAGAVELALYDISGRLVLERQFEATEPAEMEAMIDVSGLASGVYTLRANQGDVQVSARAVVVR